MNLDADFWVEDRGTDKVRIYPMPPMDDERIESSVTRVDCPVCYGDETLREDGDGRKCAACGRRFSIEGTAKAPKLVLAER